MQKHELPKESVIATFEGVLLAGTSRLNEINVQALPEMPGVTSLMMASSVTLIGLLLVLGGLFGEDPQLLFRGAGAGLLVLVLVVLVTEALLSRKRANTLIQKKLMPLCDELAELRNAITDYLSQLDQRTSRYFHCVTNTKVTAYFMLRQLEQALHELSLDLEDRAASPSAASYIYIRERLRGTIDYRDGFDFNSGKLHHTPVVRVATVIQELIQEIESGIAILEEEIQVLSARAQFPEEIKQLELPLTKTRL